MNDGSIQPLAGQEECQGNLLPGVQPGGSVANTSPSALDVSRAPAPQLIGDVNGDCVVNILDLTLVGERYLIGIGSLLYSPRYDLNGDGVINILDIQTVAAYFLQHC